METGLKKLKKKKIWLYEKDLVGIKKKIHCIIF